jgi:hypothetical protein
MKKSDSLLVINILSEIINGIYDEAGVEAPAEIDPKTEIIRLSDRLRAQGMGIKLD